MVRNRCRLARPASEKHRLRQPRARAAQAGFAGCRTRRSAGAQPALSAESRPLPDPSRSDGLRREQPPWAMPAFRHWPRVIAGKPRQPDPGWPNRHRKNRFCHRMRWRRAPSRQAHRLFQRRRSGPSSGAGKTSRQSRQSAQAAHPVWRGHSRWVGLAGIPGLWHSRPLAFPASGIPGFGGQTVPRTLRHSASIHLISQLYQKTSRLVIAPFLTGCGGRTHAAIFSCLERV